MPGLLPEVLRTRGLSAVESTAIPLRTPLHFSLYYLEAIAGPHRARYFGMSNTAVYNYMRPQDVRVFMNAAKFYDVFLLVRRTNTESIKYVGVAGYTPKRLDCKAKTADIDVMIPGLGLKKTAGLVVNPTLPGFEGAFRSPAKAQSAQETWRQFVPLCYLPEPSRPVTYFPGGKFYSVQMDPGHEHYGCVMFASNSLRTAGKYIHGDYDLYAIVPASAGGLAGSPVNVRVTETRLGQVHSRGREFFDVQHYLNRHIGVAMILHGDQEKYSPHTDEPVDVFWPDGSSVTALNGLRELQEFYANVLGGRMTFDKSVKGPQGIYHAR